MERTEEFLDEVMRLEREITDLPPADPKLAAARARVDELEREVHAARAAASPLVPESEDASSSKEAALGNLERALRSLRGAIAAKK